MRIGVYGRNIKEANLPYLKEFFSLLEKKSFEIFLWSDFQKAFPEGTQLPKGTQLISENDKLEELKLECLFSLGGDGTLLNSLRVLKYSGIPVLGINMGRLGFLSSTAKEDLDTAIDDLLAGKYSLEKRILLQLDAQPEIFGSMPYALNEFTLGRLQASSVVTVHAYVNGEFLNSYIADGLIVSTPTGSTAYSMSCGGPVVHPGSNNFVITPVAPHNLNVRPIVLPAESEISLQIEGRTESFLATLDSRYTKVDSNHKITLKKAEFSMNLVRFKRTNFFETLRDKLNWGLDERQ